MKKVKKSWNNQVQKEDDQDAKPENYRKRFKTAKIIQEADQKQEGEEYCIYENKSQSNSVQSEVSEKQQSSFEIQNDDDKPKQSDKENLQKLLQRLGLQNKINVKAKDQDLEIVVNNFVENCIGTVNREQNIEEYDKLYNQDYESKIQKKEGQGSIFISELTQLEQIKMMRDDGLFGLIKYLRLFLKRFSMLCQKIVEHSIFEAIILLVIVLNSIKMATDDPLATTTNLPQIQTAFTAIYATEMLLKICAFGFAFNKGAYLRDLWNILDFVIVCTSLLPLIITLNFSVSSLRAIRVLRPLKTITKIKALKMIVRTLFYSFELVMDSLYILLFIMFVFAIAGQQLFSGKLKYRCMVLETGVLSNNLCSSSTDCFTGYVCAKAIDSPNFSISNFDTIIWSFLTVFRTITLENWSYIMQEVQITNGFAYCIYSILIVFFCQYVILNMTMAILKYKYSQVKGNVIEEEEEELEEYEPEFLQKIGIYDEVSKLVNPPPLVRYFNEDKTLVGKTSENKSLTEDHSHNLDISLMKLLNQPKSYQTVLNIQYNNKIDFQQLKNIGKLHNHKWDAKKLDFQINMIQHNQLKIIDLQDDDKNLSEKSVDHPEIPKQSEEQEKQSEEQSFDESDQSSFEEIIEVELADKALQVQKKLHQSTKSIANKIQTNKKLMPATVLEAEKPLLKVHKDISELDKMLFLIGTNSGANFRSEKAKVQIPDIDVSHIEMEKLYERFDDLGDFKIKRAVRKNELEFFEIKHSKKQHQKKEIKKSKIPIKEMLEENVLDIKELHLKNQLQKKSLKSRIKDGDSIEATRAYDINRVIVSQKVRENMQKNSEIKENMNSLVFNVKYQSNPTTLSSKMQETSIFRRNLIHENEGLRLPEMIHEKSKKNMYEVDTVSLKSIKKDNEYLKLLQNHQFEDKIDLEMNKVMSIFFKKEKKLQKKQEEFSYASEYQKIIEEDVLKRHGHLHLELPLSSINNQQALLEKMNMQNEEYDIYIKGVMGVIKVVRKKILLFITKPLYDNSILLVVIFNTVIMSLSGYVNTDQAPYSTMSSFCNYMFIADLSLKLIAYDIIFFGDIMNVFDAVVVCISIVQMSLGTSNLSALRSIRILRAFRVLRITRLIRSLSYMRVIMNVVTSVITEFIYVFMLLVLFIFIYTLLGMQIFGGVTRAESVIGVRQKFDTFFYAVFSVFQVITVENWNDVETAILTSTTGPWANVYLISLIFIGNWILINLLQAILLDGFDTDSDDKNQDESNSNDQLISTSKEVQSLTQTEEDKDSLELQSQVTDSPAKTNQDDASLFIFGSDNMLRIGVTKLMESSIFEGFIFLSIILSSFKLAMDSYVVAGTSLSQISSIMDLVFNGIFIFEAATKILSLGFVLGENAYLKNGWNKLDFFIVASSIIDMSLSSVNLSILKLLRTLRPLRIVSRNQEMKIIITSLAQSIIGIFNVLIIIICVFLMFGILGMNLLQGKLNYCNVGTTQLSTPNYGPYSINQAQCEAGGGVWELQFINFENIGASLVSLYVFSTRENWPFYAFSFIDASDDGPVKDNNTILYFLFSVAFILVGTYFFMDLLVGVLFMNFHESERKIRPKRLTDKQINWQNLQKIIVDQDPCFQLYLEPQNPIRKMFFKLVTFGVFEVVITMCIVANIISMMLADDDITSTKQNGLNTANLVFSGVFIAELFLKLIAYSKSYFLSAWNLFDFFVVSASALDIILQLTGNSASGGSAFSILPQIARIFRVMRITRLLRMFKRFKGLQKLIETFIFSLPALAKGLSILFLYLFISSILATYLFNNIEGDYAGNFTKVRNYTDFHHALEFLFINLTGENWYFSMFQTCWPGYLICSDGSANCNSPFYLIFWLPYIFFGQKVFLELFVLIVLDQFQANYINQNNPLGIFSLFEENFRENWIEITSKYHSEKIESKKLIDLIMVLRPPLGLGRIETLKKYEEELKQNDKTPQEEINLKIQELDKKIKKNGARLLHRMNVMKNRIYFGYHQTFYNFAKLAIVPEFYDEANPFQKETLDNLHKQSEEKLQKIRPAGNLFYYQEDNQEAKESQPLNPISLILFTQMIVKSWNNYAIKYNLEKNALKNNTKPSGQAAQTLNNSCASDISEAKYEKIPFEKKIALRRGGLLEGKEEMARNCQFMCVPNLLSHYSNHPKNKKYKISISQRNSICKDNRSSKKSERDSQDKDT